MYFLVRISSQELAEFKNNQLALRNGCNGNLTSGLGAIIKHPSRTEWAIGIQDIYLNWLTEGEKQDIITYEQALIDGWISEEELV